MRLAPVLVALAACTVVAPTGDGTAGDTGREPPGYDASCDDGTHCNPLVIDQLPFVATGDTRDSTERHIDRYSCGDSDEAGSEVWYVVELAGPGTLTAGVNEVSGDGIDVDVHILTSTEADSCLARGNVTASAAVDAGFVFVVVDTWRGSSGTEYPGPYELLVTFDADEPTVDPTPTDPTRDTGDTDDGTVDTGTTPLDTGTVDTDPTGSTGPCPADMVAIEDYCIDRYEAHIVGHDPFTVPSGGVAANAAGAIPQGYISGEVAADACDAAGKRLCSSSEWLRACEGPSGNTYPYGDVYDPYACNDTYSGHPIVDVFGSSAQWNSTEMNDPRLNQLPDSLATSGEFGECMTDEGVFDMHGNLHEWVDDPSGVFRGGFYVDAVINGTGCGYATTRHTFDYHDYSTGFRCCADQ